MEINVQKNIYYQPFNSRKELKEKILEFILNSNLDKVIYKGDVMDMNYKLMKKIIAKSEEIRNKNIDPEDVKKKYKKIIDMSGDQPFCLIYKK